MSENTEKTTNKKGTSTTAIAVQRLKEKQLNLVFGALSYDELVRVKQSLETALIPASKIKVAKLQKDLKEAEEYANKNVKKEIK